MALTKIVIMLAKCDIKECTLAEELRLNHMPDAVKVLKHKGWWVRQHDCFCPMHAKPFVEADIQRTRRDYKNK